MNKKEAIKENESSNEWLYELFTHKSNENYRIIRRKGITFYLMKDDICG